MTLIIGILQGAGRPTGASSPEGTPGPGGPPHHQGGLSVAGKTITHWGLLLDRTIAVVAFVVRAIGARAHARHPSRIVAIPFNGPGKSRLKIHDRLPAGFAHQFLTGESVAPVVARTVRHIGDQALGLAGECQHLRTASRLGSDRLPPML